MTIAQWFEQNFGKDVEIDGMKDCGRREIVRAYLPLDKDGSIFVLCGGQCIMAFETAAINKRPVYVVVEAGHRREGTDHRNRLVLAQSA